MSNIDKQALRIPERKKHNWGQAVMRVCDFCQQWALTVRHSDGGYICASCCDSEYTTALSSALVVALDELEAVQKTSAARLGVIDTAHKMFQRERDRADAAEKRNSELSQKADIYDMLREDYGLNGSLVDFVDWQAKRISELEEKQRLINICQGKGLEHRIAAEKRAEDAEKRSERALSLLSDANTENVWDVIGRLKVVIGGDYRSEAEIAAAGKGE